MKFTTAFQKGVSDMMGGYGLAVALFVFGVFVLIALIPRNPVATPTAAASQLRSSYDRLAA